MRGADVNGFAHRNVAAHVRAAANLTVVSRLGVADLANTLTTRALLCLTVI
jgi:hypothetical protein